MKRILLVEDDPERIKWFKQSFIGYVLDITKSTIEAIEWLKEKQYNLLFLDNDLSLEHYENMRDMVSGMGYDVALFLEEYKENNPKIVTITHTCNPYAGSNICKALRYRDIAIHIPFPQLKEMYQNGTISFDF